MFGFHANKSILRHVNAEEKNNLIEKISIILMHSKIVPLIKNTIIAKLSEELGNTSYNVTVPKNGFPMLYIYVIYNHNDECR